MAENHGREPFRFSDPHQLEVYRLLADFVEGPAAFFRDACRIMDEPDHFLSTVHLVSHLLREIESGICNVCLGLALEEPAEQGDEPDGRRTKIKRVLATLEVAGDDPLAEQWLQIPSFHKRAHRRDLGPPHPADDDFHEIWTKAVRIFGAVMDRLKTNYLKVIPTLDGLLSASPPTKKHASTLANHIPHDRVTLSYFFDRLSDPRWLPLLRDRGYFARPAPPLYHEDEETVSFPPWPLSEFLSRMAEIPQAQADVIAIANEIPDTDNPRVMEDLADAACKLPPDSAAILIPKACSWLERRHTMFFPEKLGKLAVKLGEGGYPEEALALIDALLSVSAPPGESRAMDPEARPRIELYEYQRIVDDAVAPLVATCGLPLLSLLTTTLSSAIVLTRHSEEDGVPEDYSWIWRPAIEDDSGHHGGSAKDALVTAVRRVAMGLTEGVAEPREVIDILVAAKWPVFRRIAAHVLTEGLPGTHELAAAWLRDGEGFGGPQTRREFGQLLESTFASLEEPDREAVLAQIVAGPKVPEGRDDISPDEADRFQKQRQCAWLALIAEHLSTEWKERYETLLAEVGPQPSPTADTGPQVFTRGWESPVSSDDLREKSVPDIAAYLREWEPADSFDDPSREGLGQVVKALAKESPLSFSQEAMTFQGLDPTYVRNVFDGLTDAVKNGEQVDWRPILELARWSTEQEPAGPSESRYMDRDPDWGWTRKSIAELLRVGFDDGEAAIPFKLRKEVWAALEPVTADRDPTPDGERGGGENAMDPSTRSLNTVRGQAFHTLLVYVGWVHRHLGGEEAGVTLEAVPEAREILDAHLDLSVDASPTIRSVYGWRLPWLYHVDPDWTRSRIASVFCSGGDRPAIRSAAWEGYILFNKPFDVMLPVLRGEYEAAIERLHEHDGRMHSREAQTKLAEHLLVFYARGLLDLEDSLIVRFFEVAGDDVRGHIFRTGGNWLRDEDHALPEEPTQRLMALAEWRIAALREEGGGDRELIWFGYWFLADAVPVDWSLPLAVDAARLAGTLKPDNDVAKRLAAVAEQHPLPSVECLEAMVVGDTNGWNIRRWRESMREVLRKARRSGVVDAERAATALIHRLGAMGFLDFRDLLD